MALLTAEDVLNKAFQKTRYREGFDQDEVDEFLDEVADTIAALTAERDELQRRLAAGGGAPITGPTPQVAPEGSLIAAATDPNPPSATTMLAMAQKLHDDYVQAGEAEREKIMDEARAKAEEIVRQAEKDAQGRLGSLEAERAELERSIDDLRRFERDYRGHLRNYLENLLGDLEHSASKGASAPVAAVQAPSADAPGVGAAVPAVAATPVSDAYPTAVNQPVEPAPGVEATPSAVESTFAPAPQAAPEPEQPTLGSGAIPTFPGTPEADATQAFDELSGLGQAAPAPQQAGFPEPQPSFPEPQQAGFPEPQQPGFPEPQQAGFPERQPSFPEPQQDFAPHSGVPGQPEEDSSGAIPQPPAAAPQEDEGNEMPRWNF